MGRVETGCDNNGYIRKYGYSIQGTVPQIPSRRSKSMLLYIAVCGFVALELTAGMVDSDVFYRGTIA